MCFTPLASIITAIIEFIVTGYLFYKIKDKKLYPLAFFVLFLGLYQFTEFMLCVFDNDFFWARVGFAVYTFMPILIGHFFVNVSGKKLNQLYYIIPIFFSAIALFYPDFITYTSCSLFHVNVESLIFNENYPLMFIYLFYYLIFPIYGLLVFSRKLKVSHSSFASKLAVIITPLALLFALIYYFWSTFYEFNQNTTWIHTSAILITSLLILILLFSLLMKKYKELFYKTASYVIGATGLSIILLYYLIPNISYSYSSIFCQFALLYALASILLINALDGKAINRQT